MKRFISLMLIVCLMVPCAFAEEEKPHGVLDSVGEWFGQAAEDTANWASKAWDDTSAWATKAWDDTSAWATKAWQDVSDWTAQAWEDSSEWVSQAWEDGTNWASTNWDHFIVWANTLASGDPYSWLEDSVLDAGILAYERYADCRSFLDGNPDEAQIHEKYDEVLSELSLLNEDKDIIWEMLRKWTAENDLPLQQCSELLLPFLMRLPVEGEAAIGEGVAFSGPVVAQYLLTVLEAMELDSAETVDMRLKILHSSLNDLTRPVIIGDTDQNTLVTEDHYYIENFTYADGKYQIFMIASMKDDESQYPMLRGETLEQTAREYFAAGEFGAQTEIETENGAPAEGMPFTYQMEDAAVQGEAVAVWTQENNYLFFVVTDQEWSDEEFRSWFDSISLTGTNSINFAVDMESDGSFYGVNQGGQKYTINRIFDEEKFQAEKGGHGWAAERGNNLVDNLKGIFTRIHSKIVGNNNIKNGPDRLLTLKDGTELQIQSKYHNSASSSIASCFSDGQFRYFNNEGNPMAIEVPADQYDDAVRYMKNRIANGEVEGVTDVERASEIVKKGNLTYQQAKHIAKAGTVESILYDSAHACVTAGTSLGISAAVGFAVDLWNGEPFEVAMKESILQGLQIGGTSFIISVLSSQIAKTGLNSAMIPASKVIVRALGPKVSAAIVNAFRPAGSAIHGVAAMKSAAKLLRGNAISSTVTLVVLSAGDVADIIRGRISWKQLAKNVSTSAVGISGGALGYLGGVALGTAIAPGAGTAIGIIVSIAAGWGANKGAEAVADMIAEDDADEMIQIIEAEFPEIASEYFLNEDEVNQAIENLQGLITAEMLKQMYQYRDHEDFARQLIEMAIDPVAAERERVELPSEDEYSECLTTVLEAIYEDVSGEAAAE